jgi:hypothetical protein
VTTTLSTRDAVVTALSVAITDGLDQPQTPALSQDSILHVVKVAASEPFTHASVTDVLEAYLIVHPQARQYEDTFIRGVRTSAIVRQHLKRIVTHALSTFITEPTSIDEMVDFLLAHPNQAPYLAKNVLRAVKKYQFAHRLPSLGLLSREIYEHALFSPTIARSTYLEQHLEHLEHLEPPLSPSQLRIALTLRQEWAGTLPSLVETARALGAA